MKKSQKKSDIVILDTRGSTRCLRLSEVALEAISIDTPTKQWTRWKNHTAHPIGTFVDGIGVYDVSETEQLQKLVNDACRDHFTKNYVPDAYDE